MVEFSRRQQRSCNSLNINGTAVERLSSFRWLGVHTPEDLTWTVHVQAQSRKARQHLYHLRQLRKSGVPVTFYSSAVESVGPRIIRASSHPSSCLFNCLNQANRSVVAKKERHRKSFYLQTIRLKQDIPPQLLPVPNNTN